jgi:hypothetical protein
MMGIDRGVFLVPWSGYNVESMVDQLKESGADFISLSIKDSMGRSWTRSDVVPHWAQYGDLLERVCDKLHNAGLRVRASVACFADAYHGQLHPDWVATGPDGVPAQRPGWEEDWYYHLCPTKPGVREVVLRYVDELVSRYPVDGVDLDFIRFPWKAANGYAPEREFCFCSRCRGQFTEATGISVTDLSAATFASEWYAWRCSVITSMVEEVSNITGPRNVDLAPFIAFWTSDGFGEVEVAKAQRRFGQDHAALGRICTQISPMLYHRFTGEPSCYTLRSLRWVRDITWHLWEQGSAVCSVIQGGPPAQPLEVIDAVRSSVDAGAVAVMAYPGLSWTLDNDYWVKLGQAYRELEGLEPTASAGGALAVSGAAARGGL